MIFSKENTCVYRKLALSTKIMLPYNALGKENSLKYFIFLPKSTHWYILSLNFSQKKVHVIVQRLALTKEINLV